MHFYAHKALYWSFSQPVWRVWGFREPWGRYPGITNAQLNPQANLLYMYVIVNFDQRTIKLVVSDYQLTLLLEYWWFLCRPWPLLWWCGRPPWPSLECSLVLPLLILTDSLLGFRYWEYNPQPWMCQCMCVCVTERERERDRRQIIHYKFILLS